MPGLRSVVQRAEWPKESKHLVDLAVKFNMAYSGKLESRHAQAVVVDEDDRMKMYTQRWMAKMEAVELPKAVKMEDDDYVIGDQGEDENIHAEMLAISWYLQDKAGLPVAMGVSKPVCARCSIVLDYFGIAHKTDGTKTRNWVSPWRHAGQYPPKKLKGKIPEKVWKGKVYLYDDKDWK